ncbi:MAG: SOS response-associated peptidase [Chloroflexi bacterium]|nr:SOS response-associated peptidase [Chloroflexota bacterium]MDA1218398.1 SOS response-associated peptidase [Chloroflexota bacterium]PKB57393.1 MAG: hypothetical protein BZY73_03480 [SAR202 cluster bacterium Casp-Chloro-G3]
MCGRFTLNIQGSMIAEWFDIHGDVAELTPRYNIAPTQQIPVIRNDGEQNNLTMMRWGLVPFWAKEINSRYTMINARDDKILETRSYVGPFKTKRCLVPATGFYEWKKGPKKTKQPMLIRLNTGDPFAFAGIWEQWQDHSNPDAELVVSCSIITTSPNALMEPIHDRMPVILPPDLYADWLNPANQDIGYLKEMLLPFDPGLMEAFPVSELVGNVRNDRPELIEALLI